MTRLRRLRSLSTTTAKLLLGFVAALLLIVVLVIGVVETEWGKNRLRDLIVRQANPYLTATLSIGRLEGSLLRGIQLGDVDVGRGDQTLIHIDEIAATYSLRELFERGIVIRRVRLTRPRVVAARLADGRWDLGALVKRAARDEARSGPDRPIEIQSIEVVDGHVTFRDPFDFGDVHLPTDFASLNASFSFAYEPVKWRMAFAHASFIGHAPDLTVARLSGRFGNGPGGWFFENLSTETLRSAFTLDGRIDHDGKPADLDLRVRASRFAFQEWSGVLHGLKNITVDASFDTSLKGPLARLGTDLQFTGTGGSVKGRLMLDTTVPGWHAAGAVDVERLNLARWLNRPNRPSDISGHATFDLALELGHHFPRGVYTFDGPHAMFMGYAADKVRASGQITASAVLVARAQATAYGADMTMTQGSIGVDEPFLYRFQGTTNGVDLRRVPATVPVPHVDSLLTFDYDVSGRFSRPFIAGRAQFAPSQFLGATIGAGAVGTIDSSQQPLRYAGAGEIDGVSLRRFGDDLDVAWMRDPRYAGTVSGHFHADGSGTDRRTLALTGGGRLTRADLFTGTLSNADVSIEIASGTLSAAYDGQFAGVDPAVPFADSRLASTLTGSGRLSATVRDLLTRETTIADYEVAGALALRASVVRDIQVDTAQVDATLSGSTIRVADIEMTGPAIEGHGHGIVPLTDEQATDFQYDVARVDLAPLAPLTGLDAVGVGSTKGQLTGRSTALHASGDAEIVDLSAFDVAAHTVSGQYDVTFPTRGARPTAVRVTGRGSLLTLFEQPVQEASGTVTLDADRLGVDVEVVQAEGRSGHVTGHAVLHTDRHEAEVADLTVTLGRSPWQLVTRAMPPTVSWSDQGVAVAPVEFAGGTPGSPSTSDERVGLSGTWRRDGTGALRVTATHLSLDTLQAAFGQATRYGGILDLDATLRGTREVPLVSGTLVVTGGRVERVSYQKLDGRFSYAGRMFDVAFRLDQAPGIWVTAEGTVPLGSFVPDLPEQPLDVAIKSSAISLGLIEGVTDAFRDVTGEIQMDVKAVGTSHDPHVTGTVSVANAAFLITSTGSTYKKTRAALTFATDKITVDALHVEDANGQSLDVHGSLGTHEMRVGELEIEGTARKFEVMRNALGRVDVAGTVQLRGRFEEQRISGSLTIVSGSTLKVDEILQRTLFQPYSTNAAAMTDVDAVVALNPWGRLGLDLELHVPGTLRLTGENVQVSPGTPIGLGAINLRTTGDLYLYKDPGQPLSVTGSFDSISGTYAFQGRQFDVIPASSINFRGDLNPEIYVTVTRVISGVEARVSIFGPMLEPELRLASTPPLDESDILALIVFNTSTNQLSSAQQQTLMVRAGALAAGFIAGPIVSAIANETGIDILEIEAAGDLGAGPRITIGEEIAPGLVARFSRQFGQDPYDEATVEYALSRVLRLRATFSDAQSLSSRSPFRRIERAGVDLLFFFSF